MKHKEKHEFALFAETLFGAKGPTEDQRLTICDKELYHRMVNVLRLSKGESCILFNNTIHCVYIIEQIDKNNIFGTITQITKNPQYKPFLRCALPILKRTDLDTALSTLTEIGINSIQLIKTERSHHYFSQDFSRLERIMIAAAEQSKNFTIPLLHKPISLHELIATYPTAITLFFHPSGKNIYENMHNIIQKKDSEYLFIIGPEADLSVAEQEILDKHTIHKIKLTPTTLKAVTAAQLAAGILRSFL